MSNNDQTVECRIEYRLPNLLFELYRRKERKSIIGTAFEAAMLETTDNRAGTRGIEKTTFKVRSLADTWRESAICGSYFKYAACLYCSKAASSLLAISL